MRKNIYILAGIFYLILGCTEQENITGLETQKSPIYISQAYPSTTMQTRAAIDGGFVAGDESGIFVVDYDSEDKPGIMAVQGNRASNIRYTMQEDGSWTAPVQLYWDVKGAAADFYGYYPFDGNLSSVTAYRFAVESMQDSEATSTKLAGYTASDLLWAKKEHIFPTTETVTLQYQHLMAGVIIHLEKGTGFSSEDWINLEKTIFVKNTIVDGTVDLTTGTASVNSGSKVQSIRPLLNNGDFRAILYPQTVEANKELIQVLIDGKTYSLKKTETMIFQSGKMHQFTITVDRSTTTGDYECHLVDEAVVPWVDDGDLHEGLVHEYILVEVERPGTFHELIAQQVSDLTKVTNLKIDGNINQDDLRFLWDNLPNITRLNLQKAVIEDGTLNGISQGWDVQRHFPLESIIFPEKGLKVLGGFDGCSLRGSLSIPEGVEEVSGFGANFFTGTLTLPSTLKRLYLCLDPFKGNLIIPDGLEIWAPAGFGNQGRLTGTIHLPSTLKEIRGYVPDGLTGTINIPQGCDISGGTFEASQCTSLILPEGMTDIPGYCFRGSQISGEVVIPSTVTHIGGHAFRSTKITKVIFPDALKFMERGGYYDDGPFSETRLSGTLTLPKNVASIPAGCFTGCYMITGLVIPAGTKVLGENCFAGCSSIGSIVCQGDEPPILLENAFLGVPKDNFTVEVPKGCVEKYRNAHGWSDFKRIAEYSNFVCRPAQACALNNKHEEELVLNADGAWTVTSKPDWVTLSSTSGTGKTTINATFQSLSHGAGNRTGEVVFEMTTGGKTVNTLCKLSQYDYEYEEDSYLALQTATKGQLGGIDIVFLGDGFDGASISDGSYLDLVRYQTECFFGIEPYKSMREYFNVYVTFPLSQEKGVNTMYTYVNNRFGTLQGISSLLTGAQRDNTSSQLIMETDEVRDYVVNITPVEMGNLWRTLVIAVPNTTDYESNTVYCNDGPSIAICPPSEQSYPRDTRGVIQHEAGGHAFAYLGDEMIVRSAFAPITVKNDIEEKHGWGWYPNLATTGKLNSVPWAEFIFDPDYSDYVDVFEGAYGFTRGIYRPEANSCMNYGIPYYNTPSRLAIYRRILDYAGEEFRMENFRAQDTFEWGATEITRAAARDVKDLTPITVGNHCVPTIIRYREVGDKVRAIRKKIKAKNDNK